MDYNIEQKFIVVDSLDDYIEEDGEVVVESALSRFTKLVNVDLSQGWLVVVETLNLDITNDVYSVVLFKRNPTY
jgi:hypothetical protein